MQVVVKVLFDSPSDDDIRQMRDLARELTDDRRTVRVDSDPEAPRWLVARFTMPTEAQYKAVAKIDGVLRYQVDNRLDSIIAFRAI
jgi:hypothetical protein